MKLIKILSALTIDTINWLYPLVLTLIAGVLEGWLILSLFPEISPLVLVAIFPILYFFWLFIFLCLSALGTNFLFLFVRKPKNLEIDILEDLPLLIQFSPTSISYRVLLLISTLPGVDYLKITPITLKWLRNLVMRAYSPKVHIGKRCLIVIWPARSRFDIHW
jgi:hypothetical protein